MSFGRSLATERKSSLPLIGFLVGFRATGQGRITIFPFSGAPAKYAWAHL